MTIPVFHDDQHGTAIISGAALINALELAGKDIGEIRCVFSAPAQPPSPGRSTTCSLGVQRENIVLVRHARAWSTTAA